MVALTKKVGEEQQQQQQQEGQQKGEVDEALRAAQASLLKQVCFGLRCVLSNDGGRINHTHAHARTLRPQHAHIKINQPVPSPLT